MKAFEEPMVTVMVFKVEDVITTSSGGDYDSGEGGMPVMPLND